MTPFISTVILIALVVGIGIIISGWLTHFAAEQTETATTKSGEKITCTYASLYVRNATYNCTSDKLSLKLENTGKIDLVNFRVGVIFNNGSSPEFYLSPNETIRAGSIKIMYNSSIDSDDINQINVISAICPNEARDTVSGNSIYYLNC